MVTAQAWRGRSENSIDVARTHWQRTENAMQSSPSVPRLYYVNEVPTRFSLRRQYVNAVVTTSLLSSFCVLIRPRPHYVFLNMSKVRPRPPRPWRPYHVLIGFYCVPTTLYKVLTASIQFLEDVVGTWLVWQGFKGSAVSTIDLHWKICQNWVWGGDFEGRAKIFGGNPLGMQWPPIYVVWGKIMEIL